MLLSAIAICGSMAAGGCQSAKEPEQAPTTLAGTYALNTEGKVFGSITFRDSKFRLRTVASSADVDGTFQLDEGSRTILLKYGDGKVTAWRASAFVKSAKVSSPLSQRLGLRPTDLMSGTGNDPMIPSKNGDGLVTGKNGDGLVTGNNGGGLVPGTADQPCILHCGSVSAIPQISETGDLAGITDPVLKAALVAVKAVEAVTGLVNAIKGQGSDSSGTGTFGANTSTTAAIWSCSTEAGTGNSFKIAAVPPLDTGVATVSTTGDRDLKNLVKMSTGAKLACSRPGEDCAVWSLPGTVDDEAMLQINGGTAALTVRVSGVDYVGTCSKSNP